MPENLYQTEIEYTVKGMKGLLNPCDRFTSFDYCYNYFLSTEDLTADIEKSCLILGFFLASWGMYRGKSFLLQKSVRHYKDTIVYINELDKSVWGIDVDSYTEKNIEIILDIYKGIKESLIPDNQSDKTLVTKVMLGVFGFIPAFDNNFCSAFRSLTKGQCGFRAVNNDSLGFIRDFYKANSSTIDCLSNYFTTTNFATGEKTNIRYPKAKIIDMYGFAIGKQKIADTKA